MIRSLVLSLDSGVMKKNEKEKEKELTRRDTSGSPDPRSAAATVRDGSQQELLTALQIARETIRTWHSIGMPERFADGAWSLYQSSPEMRTINAAIAKAEGRHP